MSDFAEIATVAVTSVMAVFLFVVITPLICVFKGKSTGSAHFQGSYMYFPAVVYTV